MNDFCLYCTGNDKQEVVKCRDKKCPFYRDKWANLNWQVLQQNIKKEKK